MFLSLTVPSQRNLRWRFSPCWARITAHRRLVLVLAICGAVVGLLVSGASPKVYAARVIIRIEHTYHLGYSRGSAEERLHWLVSRKDGIWTARENPAVR
jgi:hypothetical protein